VSQSHREKPVYHVHAQVDMTKAIAFRAAAKAGTADAAGGVSWDAILVRASAMALTEEPLFRRWFRGDELAEHTAIDVAVAVGVADDLFVPAVRSPAGKTAAAVSKEIEALARKAESRTLTAQDVEGSCFLVSNLGMFPVDSFDAIIHPEHSAALAVGAVTPTPVSDGKNTWIAPLARLTLTVDHRLLNGRTAARFLALVKQTLETGAFA
jgi:pyruvate dehydrogenase E2 component (dihydrolipoamide acetyltransferase)